MYTLCIVYTLPYSTLLYFWIMSDTLAQENKLHFDDALVVLLYFVSATFAW